METWLLKWIGLDQAVRKNEVQELAGLTNDYNVKEITSEQIYEL